MSSVATGGSADELARHHDHSCGCSGCHLAGARPEYVHLGIRDDGARYDGSGNDGGYGLLIVFLVLLGIVLLVLATMRRGSSGPDPLEILKQRLARGEVTREQYEEFKQLIQS